MNREVSELLAKDKNGTGWLGHAVRIHLQLHHLSFFAKRSTQ